MWTSALVEEHLEETYGVTYSIPSCRRLLKEARLTYQKHAGKPPTLAKTSKKSTTSSKKGREMDASVVCIGQAKKSVQLKPRAAWFRRGTRPSIGLSTQRDWTRLLGAITEDRDRFFSRFAECATTKYARYFIFAVYKEFRYYLIVSLVERRIFRRQPSRSLEAVAPSSS